MSLSRIIVRQAVSQARSKASPRAYGGSRAGPRAIAAVLAAWLAWHAAAGSITPRSGLGYALGVVGGSMMLVLMLYPVRKRLPLVRRWLPLKYWLSLHVLCGLAGPLLVLLHSGFSIRSVNAAVAMVTMILVVASGIVGRYLYRRVHNGAGEAQARAGKKRESFDVEAGRLMAEAGAVGAAVHRFGQLACKTPAGWGQQTRHFMEVETGLLLARYRIRRAVGRASAGSSSPGYLTALQRAAFEAIASIHIAAQFAAYERLFSLWRTVHVPFVLVMLVSAIVHVVAAHAY